MGGAVASGCTRDRTGWDWGGAGFKTGQRRWRKMEGMLTRFHVNNSRGQRSETQFQRQGITVHHFLCAHALHCAAVDVGGALCPQTLFIGQKVQLNSSLN
ncbi:hypothetical protein JZ751_021777 [Albula glossodonta]|uniref:Uncharacterized protein n=1 Tax=Albula glossodonta TaxID=121402 RepID=A0A8T2NIV7_9TELE|nr:hypothetical protein JZ751_021777 [Albula glossodonta]